MIRVDECLAIEEGQIAFSFILASGPGGQNINKVRTAAQLRFTGVGQLPADVQARLRRLAGARMSRNGVVVITAKRYRSQERNREDALARLLTLIARAAAAPSPRVPTGPTRAEREKRLRAKARRSAVKSLRARPTEPD